MAARRKAAPKRGASPYKTSSKKPLPALVWFLSGAIVGVFISTLLQLNPGDDAIQRQTIAESKKTTAQPNKATSTNKPKFEFYTLLSESEDLVAPEAVPEQAPPPPSPAEVAATQQADAARAQAILEGKTPPPAPAVKKETTMHFYLQAGSFSERSAAESVRAQLLLSGQQVHIEPGQVADKTWHRVLVGPFASREQLDVAQKQLASNGFNNLLLQQRKGR